MEGRLKNSELSSRGNFPRVFPACYFSWCLGVEFNNSATIDSTLPMHCMCILDCTWWNPYLSLLIQCNVIKPHFGGGRRREKKAPLVFQKWQRHYCAFLLPLPSGWGWGEEGWLKLKLLCLLWGAIWRQKLLLLSALKRISSSSSKPALVQSAFITREEEECLLLTTPLLVLLPVAKKHWGQKYTVPTSYVRSCLMRKFLCRSIHPPSLLLMLWDDMICKLFASILQLPIPQIKIRTFENWVPVLPNTVFFIGQSYFLSSGK